jgi:ATP-binding cassette subfamily B protein
MGATNGKRGTDLRLFARLARIARPYWWHLAGVVGLSLFAVPLALLAPLPLKIVVDNVFGSEPPPRWLTLWLPHAPDDLGLRLVWAAIALLIGTTLLIYLQGLASSWIQTYTSEKLLLSFRSRLFHHVQRLSLSYHDTKGTTDSAYRIQYDAQSIQTFLISGVVPLMTAALTLFGMIIVMFCFDKQIALVALLVCPVLFVLSHRFRRQLSSRWREVKALDSAAFGVIQEVLGALRVVKAFGREDYEQERFVRHSDARVRQQLKVAMLQGKYELCVGLTIAAGTGLVLYFGVRHVRAGTLTLGSLMMVMGYLAQMYEPLKLISKKLADLQSSMIGAERALSILDEFQEVVQSPNARSLVKARGALTLHNVSFGYNPERLVLRGVCFDVPQGARVGLQGKTGAGKSTLIGLLMRFYDPNSGEILLDGVNLKDYRLADLRNQFALVLQDPVLFSASIEENIRYGNPDANHEQIIEVAKKANAHEFISRLPEGYLTRVGERGVKLSGGERQRISLARAFLKNAPLLVLDEPTSAVDVKTESAIMEALDRLMQGRTTFIIAHRLSTLANCDLRLEIQEGRVVEVTSRDGSGAGVTRQAANHWHRNTDVGTIKSVNLYPQRGNVTVHQRELRNGHSGCVVWMTGLSGAGKSTLATELESELFNLDRQVYVLDGDNIRHGLCSDLGFSPSDRTENIRRIGEMAKVLADAGFICITAFISPYREDRAKVRQILGPNRFIEVFVNAPLSICEQRDPKGLYAKARAKEINEFTGISAPYEPPLQPEIELRTDKMSVADCVASILDHLQIRGTRTADFNLVGKAQPETFPEACRAKYG